MARKKINNKKSKTHGQGIPRGIPWNDIPELGKIPDSHLARKLGCAQQSVRYARISRDIPLFEPRKTKSGTKKRNSDDRQLPKLAAKDVQGTRIDWDSQPLGQMTDVALAKKLGCAAESVLYQRRRRGIAPYDKNAPAASKKLKTIRKTEIVENIEEDTIQNKFQQRTQPVMQASDVSPPVEMAHIEFSQNPPNELSMYERHFYQGGLAFLVEFGKLNKDHKFMSTHIVNLTNAVRRKLGMPVEVRSN